MTLATSSADIVGFILFYSDAFAITKLIECGASLLNAKIMQSCKDLELRSFPFMKFPYSLFNFPNLTSLTIEHHNKVHDYPLRMSTKGGLPLPSTSVPSLVKLDFSFIQSFEVLQLENGVPLLSTFFPNLKSLRLDFRAIELTRDHMAAVPRGLEDLTLISRSNNHRSPAFVLFNLPPTLRSLYISIGPILTDSATKDYLTVSWPPSLTSLVLHHIDPCIVHHLPPHLERLELYLSPNGGKSFPLPVPTSILPTTLTAVNIFDITFGESFFVVPSTFPPALTACEIPFDFSSQNPIDWSHLPKSLTTFPVTLKLAETVSIHTQLPNLKKFPYNVQYLVLPDTFLSSLPPKLTTFRQSYALLSSIPSLPSTIRDLRLKISPFASTSQSSEPAAFCGDMSRLPPHLTNLELLNASVEHKFCKADFLLLPSSIQTLTLELHDIEDHETLAALPPYLTDLKISIADKPNKKLISDFLLLNDFPSGLKSLSIVIRMDGTSWREWLLRLGRFHALERLIISISNVERDIDPVSLAFLATLPESITELTIPLHETIITPELMNGLPKKLSSLTFKHITDSRHLGNEPGSFATDQCFANLPRSLVVLHFPHELVGLTPDLLNLLPTSLIQLTLPKHISPKLHSFYAREPEWTGYKPHRR